MRRLRRIANNFVTYELTSPIWVSETLDMGHKFDLSGVEHYEEYEKLIKQVQEDMAQLGESGLAQFIWEDSEIYGLIKSIIVGVKNNQALTTVKTIRELTSEEMELLKDYIEGQFSDGWGEGFEQHPFTEWEEYYEEEEYDEEEDEYYPYEYSELNSYCAHFWNNDGDFKFEVVKK